MSELRLQNLDRIDNQHFDVAIIGGGINGAVAAASLSGRGVKVMVIDRGDWAAQTSQESSNLVWGGFKYMESYDLFLVRKLCMSRNRLMKAYPANVQEISFLAAMGSTAPFPQWLAGLGSVAYWGFGNFKTAPPRLLSTKRVAELEPVIDVSDVRGGLEYADAHLRDNDARFVFSFIRSAIDSGAVAANYVELVDSERIDDRWYLNLRDVDGDNPLACTADTVVNCTGPFIDPLNDELKVGTNHRIVHSKGIHLVVDQLTPNHRVLAFFDDTERLFYVIPMGRRSVIGTTDTRVDHPTKEVTDEDRSFLLGQINARLNLERPLTEADIISERCGTRPLVVETDGTDRTEADWTSLSRKHEIEVDHDRGVVSVFGGKLTDCLNVGEEIADACKELGVEVGPDNHTWYGEPPAVTRDAFYRQARGMDLDALRIKENTEPLSDRLWRRYGRRAFEMLDEIRENPVMGEDIMASADYLRVELHHTAQNEMVVRLEDFLRRRSKISQVVPSEQVDGTPGLREVAGVLFGPSAQARLDQYHAAETA